MTSKSVVFRVPIDSQRRGNMALQQLVDHARRSAVYMLIYGFATSWFDSCSSEAEFPSRITFSLKSFYVLPCGLVFLSMTICNPHDHTLIASTAACPRIAFHSYPPDISLLLPPPFQLLP